MVRVGGGVAGVETRVACGVDAELDDEQAPLGLRPGPAGRMLEQRRHPALAGQRPGELLVLARPFVDAGFQQGQEQVALATELRVHDALGEPASSAICSSVAAW